MACALVDNSDLDFQPISAEQYRSNLYNQLRDPTLPDDLSTWELESLIDGHSKPISKAIRVLPDDMQWLIYKTYWSTHVMRDLVATHEFRWYMPSDRLIELCTVDPGTIQQGHSELEDMIEDHNMWAWNFCVGGHCGNCAHHGFPCTNLATYGFNNIAICELWQPNFTVPS
jgi:hypothetical protein